MAGTLGPGPDEFDSDDGDEVWDVIEVERLPGGSGMSVRVRFTSEETKAVIGRAEFEEMSVVEFCRVTVLEKALQRSWTRTTSMGQETRAW